MTLSVHQKSCKQNPNRKDITKACQHCFKLFSSQSNLNRHLQSCRAITNDSSTALATPPVTCPYCPMKLRPHSLPDHCRLKHPDRPMPAKQYRSRDTISIPDVLHGVVPDEKKRHLVGEYYYEDAGEDSLWLQDERTTFFRELLKDGDLQRKFIATEDILKNYNQSIAREK